MIFKIIRQAFSAVKTPNTKLALIVRNDLKMSKGKTAAQCSHAAILCYQKSQDSPTKVNVLDAWCFLGQPKIVLQINSLDDLLNLERKAQSNGVIAKIVKDAGRTQLEPGTATVLGIGPDAAEKIDELVRHLKLL